MLDFFSFLLLPLTSLPISGYLYIKVNRRNHSRVRLGEREISIVHNVTKNGQYSSKDKRTPVYPH